MDCKHVNSQLIDYLYQELEPDQMDQFEGHLKSCDGCASELAAFESTRSAMRELPELEPPPALSQVLMREAARAVTPEEGQGFWERLRAGVRMMVMHPAMTAAVVLVVVLGISFSVYQQGGPPSLEPKADDLPPVPPSASTAAGHHGTELAAAPQRLKQERRADDENQAEGTKAGDLKQLAQTEAPLAKAGLQKAQDPLNNAVGRSGSQAGYDNAPQADKLATVPVATRGRRAAAGPAMARRSAYRKAPGGASTGRSLNDPSNMDDLLGKGDAFNKKKGSAALNSLAGSGAGKYAKAPPPKAKPQPVRRARMRPKVAYAPQPTPRPRTSAEAATQTAKPTPSQTKTPAPKAAQIHDAYHWVAQGDAAMNKGNCPSALAAYDRALQLQPGLSKKVGGKVEKCAKYIGRDGEKKLQVAAKRYPRLAGYFTREIASKRAEATKRANREAGAPPTGKIRASKRRSKVRRAKQAAPAKMQQAPTSK